MYTSPLFLLLNHLTQFLSKNEPTLKIKTVGRCLPVSTPALSPPIPLKPPWYREGMFGGPHPDAWGPQGGLFTLFYTVLPRSGVIWVSTWFQPRKWWLKLTSGGVYCTWLQGRGAWVYRDTPVSLYWASPDCMNEQTDWRPRSFELYTVCVTVSMYMCLCTRWMRKHFITSKWNDIQHWDIVLCLRCEW